MFRGEIVDTTFSSHVLDNLIEVIAFPNVTIHVRNPELCKAPFQLSPSKPRVRTVSYLLSSSYQIIYSSERRHTYHCGFHGRRIHHITNKQSKDTCSFWINTYSSCQR